MIADGNSSLCRGHKDKIFELKWDPINAAQLVTVGMKHIKFWTLTGGGFTSKRGSFGQKGKLETMLCATYSKTPGLIYSGAANGSVYVWENGVLDRTVEAHKGPIFAVHCLEKVTVMFCKCNNRMPILHYFQGGFKYMGLLNLSPFSKFFLCRDIVAGPKAFPVIRY